MIESDQLHRAIADLPLPLAQTLRRALNAKSADGHHLGAYYFFESALKLSAAAQAGVYISLGCPEGPLNALLENVAHPATGHWLAILRDISRYLAGRKDASLLPLAGVHARLTEKGARPAGKAFLEFAAGLRGEREGRSALSAQNLFEGLVSYRNHELGHGAQRPTGVYSEGWSLILEAVLEAYRALEPLGKLTLSVARDLAEPGTGRMRRVYEALRGDGIRLGIGEVTLGEKDREIPAGWTVLVSAGERVVLHHLVVHGTDDLERDRVGFLNQVAAKTKGKDGKEDISIQRVEYLDYDSGARLGGHDAREELTSLFTRLKGRDVKAAEVEALSQAGSGEVSASPQPPSKGEWIGDFELLGELGRGGMGVVYKARQRSLGRIVALKVLPPGMAGDPVSLARFKREIAALGRCDHPNVVKVLTAGQAEGLFYYAMEYVEGSDLGGVYGILSEWKKKSGGRLKEGHLLKAISNSSKSRSERSGETAGKDLPQVEKVSPQMPEIKEGRDYYQRIAEILGEAARGVHHLHEHGIIHRDLKPGNIMLTSDGKRAVVMDLGLAQMADRSLSLTATSVKVLGTLRYMPPEQLQRNLLEVTQRADVYSLGATLYELATLGLIHDGDSEKRLIQQVLNEEPKAPRKVNPALPKDLETVIQVATAKMPQERYGSAQALAEDLEAIAVGHSIRSKRQGALYYLRHFYRRNRIATNLIIAFLGLLLSFGAFSLARINAERGRAQDNLARVYVNLAEEAYRSHDIAQQALFLSSAAKADPKSVPREVIADLAERMGGLVWSVEAPGSIDCCAVAPDQRRLVAGGRRGWLSERDVMTGRETRGLTGIHGDVLCVDYSPDGRLLAVSSADRIVSVWDVRDWRSVRVIRDLKSVVEAIAFAPDGTALFTGDGDGTIQAWDLEGTAPPRGSFQKQKQGVTSLALSPDGTTMVSGCYDGTVSLWQAGNSALIARLEANTEDVAHVGFTPDGARFVSTGGDGALRVWDAKTHRAEILRGHEGSVVTFALGPDGRSAVSAGKDRTVRLWDLQSGEERARWTCHTDWIKQIAFVATGEYVLSCGEDKRLQLWAVPQARDARDLAGHDSIVRGAAFTPDGRQVLTCGDDMKIIVWDALSGKKLAVLAGHTRTVTGVAVTPDGRKAVSSSHDGTLRVWDLASGRELPGAEMKHDDMLWGLAVSPDGRFAISGGGDRRVRVWDLSRRSLVNEFTDHTATVNRFAIAPDGCWALSGANDNTAILWDLRTMTAARRFPEFKGRVTGLGFHPDGQRLLIGPWDDDVTLWDRQGARPFLSLTMGPGGPDGATFTPDGQWVTAGGHDGTLRIWNAGSGKEVRRLPAHGGRVYGVVVSPDGQRMVSCGLWGRARLWDLGSLLRTEDTPVPNFELIGTRAGLLLAGSHAVPIPQKELLKARAGLGDGLFHRDALKGALEQWGKRYSNSDAIAWWDQQYGARLRGGKRWETIWAEDTARALLGGKTWSDAWKETLQDCVRIDREWWEDLRRRNDQYLETKGVRGDYTAWWDLRYGKPLREGIPWEQLWHRKP